jgi:hypothetical protein
MVYRAKRAQPTAKVPPKNYRKDDCPQRTVQRPVEFLGGQNRAEGDKRVKLQKPVNRPVSYLPEPVPNCGDDAKPQKQDKKEQLAYSSYRRDSHRLTLR